MAAPTCLPGAGTLGITSCFFNMPQGVHQSNGFHFFSWKGNKLYVEGKLSFIKGQWCEIFGVECSSLFFYFWNCFDTFSVADVRLGSSSQSVINSLALSKCTFFSYMLKTFNDVTS